MTNQLARANLITVEEAVGLLDSWILEDEDNRYVELQGGSFMSFIKDDSGQWEAFESGDTFQQLVENMKLDTKL